MTYSLWSVQLLLAAVFLGSGLAKSTMSRDRLLATGQTGIAPFPMPVVRFVACCEILAAFGLVLPWLLQTAPVLTPLAAVGLMVVMTGAAASHTSLREYAQVGANAVLFLLALFVAVGRF